MISWYSWLWWLQCLISHLELAPQAWINFIAQKPYTYSTWNTDLHLDDKII